MACSCARRSATRRSARSISSAARAMPGVLGAYSGQDAAADGLGAIPPVALFPGRDGKPMFAAAMPVLAATASAMSASRSRSWWRRRWRRRRTPPKRCASTSMSCRARPDIERAHRRRRAPRSTRRAPATSRSTGPTATPRRSMQPSPRPRMSSACGLPTRGLRRSRWSRAPASARSIRPAGRYTLIASTQGVAVVRKLLAEGVFKVPLTTIRVLTHDVGGGFGMKAQAYPEYGAILYAAREMRPAGEMVQQPRRELPLRLGRPRRHSGRRAGARRQGQIPRPAHAQPGRHRRLHDAIRGDLLHHEHQELPLQRLSHSGDRAST